MHRRRKNPSLTDVRDLVRKSGLTQSAFASLIHCPLRSLESWLGGQRNMPMIKYRYARDRVAEHKRSKK